MEDFAGGDDIISRGAGDEEGVREGAGSQRSLCLPVQHIARVGEETR